jgi:hypothetical protein
MGISMNGGIWIESAEEARPDQNIKQQHSFGWSSLPLMSSVPFLGLSSLSVRCHLSVSLSTLHLLFHIMIGWLLTLPSSLVHEKSRDVSV